MGADWPAGTRRTPRRTRSTGQGARQQKAGRAAWGSILNGGQRRVIYSRGAGDPEVDPITRDVRFQIFVYINVSEQKEVASFGYFLHTLYFLIEIL